jgi:hypothetical protein
MVAWNLRRLQSAPDSLALFHGQFFQRLGGAHEGCQRTQVSICR